MIVENRSLRGHSQFPFPVSGIGREREREWRGEKNDRWRNAMRQRWINKKMLLDELLLRVSQLFLHGDTVFRRIAPVSLTKPDTQSLSFLLESSCHHSFVPYLRDDNTWTIAVQSSAADPDLSFKVHARYPFSLQLSENQMWSKQRIMHTSKTRARARAVTLAYVTW